MARALTHAQLERMVLNLPADRPFTSREAEALGVPNAHRRLLVGARMLRRPVAGVFHVAELTDSLQLRLAILSLVVPADCVVTDRTAAWLWCADMALAPNDHRCVPVVSVFAPPGRRLRNGLVASGERRLVPGDVVDVGGVLVTTPLRTACDLGRLLHRDHALAAMDVLVASGMVAAEQIVHELVRFRRYRGIIQARMLAPLVDGRAQSQMESISRLRWYDAGVPRPECQVEVPSPHGGSYFIDIGLPEERFGLEYFGEAFHGPDRAEHDEERLDWARTTQAWTLVVARKDNVVGPRQDLEVTLRSAWAARPR